MISTEKNFSGLDKSFKEEKKILFSKGFLTWDSIISLSDKEIESFVKGTLSTSRKLKQLRCIAKLICNLDLSLGEASLLIHSGIPSKEALAALNPQELLHRTGRLERLLKTGRTPVVDLKKASEWIQKAKAGK